MVIWNDIRALNSLERKRSEGRLDFRTPEEQFSTDDQIERRYREPVRSPEVEKVVHSLLDAWQAGDEVGARLRAEEAKVLNRAHFQAQGVPIIAHPILPPQLVTNVGNATRDLPNNAREAALSRFVELFSHDLRPGVVQELRRGALSATQQNAQRQVAAQAFGPPMPVPKPELEPPPIGSGQHIVDSSPTWGTPREEGFLEGLRRYIPSWIAGERGPPGAPAGSNLDWDHEFQQRMRRPGFLEQLRQFGEDANSPDKQALLRSLIRQRPFARISPKDPYPEDPYRDRTAWPVRPDASGKVTVRSPYGKRWLPGAPGPEFHPGADFDNPIGGDVFAPKNGTILRIEPNSRGGGNQIFILCDDGSIIGISHTKWLEGMQEGDEVYAGQHVGVSDGSGTFSKRDGKLHPHTHISLYPPGTPVDVLLAPPTLKGASPSEEYYSARKPPWNPRDHDISAQTRLQVDPFAPGNLYGDRVHGKHFIIDRS